MRNLIIFLSTFTATILIVIFASAPAYASTGCSYDANWNLIGCDADDFPGGGGQFGGSGGSGGGAGSLPAPTPTPAPPDASWGATCGFKFNGSNFGSSYIRNNPSAACGAIVGKTNSLGDGIYTSSVRGKDASDGTPTCDYKMHKADGSVYGSGTGSKLIKSGTCSVPDDIPPPPPRPPSSPPFPDLPPPPPPSDGGEDCQPCKQLYDIQMKLNIIKNGDINNITNIVNDMSQVVNNIDNSITDLSVNQSITNNNLTIIDNSLTNLITNIENNNITQNEIKNEITNINNMMNDYSLQLGDIKLAMGDIDVKLDNTNKLILDLRPDIDFIKNNLVNGSPEGKDYTEQLNQIIELLKPCEPTAEIPCPDDDEVVKKLKEIQDYMQADFVPDTDSTEVEVEDLTDIELDRNLIKFGVAQCPPDNEFSTMVNGFSFSGGFKHKPLCDFFTLLSPFIKAFGGFSAALILGGGLRRG